MIPLISSIKEKMGATSLNVLLVFIIQGLIAFLGLVTNILISKFYGAESLGIFSYFFSLITILPVISLFGLQSSLPVFLKKNVLTRTSILKKSTFFVVLSGIITTWLTLKVTDYLNLNPKINFFQIIVLSYVIIWNICAIYSNVIRAEDKFMLSSLLSLSVRLIFLVLILITIFFTTRFELVLWAMGLSVLLSLPYTLYVALRNHFPTTINLKLMTLLKMSFPFLLQSFSIIIMYNLDRFMINYFLSFEALAVYTAYSSIINIIRLFSGVFPLVLTPLATTITFKLRKSLSKLLLFLIPFTTIIFGLSLWIVPLFYGNSYEEKWLLPFSLAIAALLLVIYSYFNALYLGEGEFLGKGKIMVIDALILSVVLNIILNCLFIPQWGLVGSSLATIITLISKILLNYLAIRKLRWIKKQAGLSKDLDMNGLNGLA